MFYERSVTGQIGNLKVKSYAALLSSLQITGTAQFKVSLSNLKTVTISAGLTDLPANALSGSSAIITVTLPSSLKTVGKSAFRLSPELFQIILPDEVTSIGDTAFQSCTQFAQIWIGSKVESIGNKAFDGCAGLTIHGVAGSYAQSYANQNNIPFSTEPLSAYGAEVHGIVKDDSGKAVQGVSVQILDLQNMNLLKKVYTDTAGRWVCNDISLIVGHQVQISFYDPNYTFNKNDLIYKVNAGGTTVETVTATKTDLVCRPEDFVFTYDDTQRTIHPYQRRN